MSEAAAWLMQIDRLTRVAVGQLELIHIISSPEYIEVPKAPGYCQRIVVWNNKIIPVVDISMLVAGTSAFYQNNAVAVALYKDPGSDEIKYGGIQLTDMPLLEKITNEQGVARSDLSSMWHPYAVSGFKSAEKEIVPIIDIRQLFVPGIDKKSMH